MRAEEVRLALEKRAARRGLSFRLGAPATDRDFAEVALAIGMPLPQPVCHFYIAFNGLTVAAPAIEVFSLDRLRLRPCDRYVDFAVMDTTHVLSLDTRELNVAGQWTVVCLDSGTTVTLTMASFWSNKLFAWIDDRKPIWLG